MFNLKTADFREINVVKRKLEWYEISANMVVCAERRPQ